MRWKSFLHASAEAKRHVSCPEEESDGASHRAQIAGNGGADSGIAAMDDSNLLSTDFPGSASDFRTMMWFLHRQAVVMAVAWSNFHRRVESG
jgi:hypothetical protein